MKRLLTIALAAVMFVSCLTVSAFAAAGDTNMLLEIGDVFGTLVQSETIDVSKGGEFTLTVSMDAALSTSADASFIGVKTTAGNVSQNTALPDGTVVTVTSLELDGTKVELDAEKSSNTVKNGNLDGNNGVVLLFKMGGLNALTGDVPAEFKEVKVTFTVNNPEAAPAEDTTTAPAEDTTAPAEDNTPAPAEDTTPAPAEDTPAPAADTSAPANTGIVLAVLPMAMAAAALVFTKRK